MTWWFVLCLESEDLIVWITCQIKNLWMCWGIIDRISSQLSSVGKIIGSGKSLWMTFTEAPERSISAPPFLPEMAFSLKLQNSATQTKSDLFLRARCALCEANNRSQSTTGSSTSPAITGRNVPCKCCRSTGHAKKTIEIGPGANTPKPCECIGGACSCVYRARRDYEGYG